MPCILTMKIELPKHNLEKRSIIRNKTCSDLMNGIHCFITFLHSCLHSSNLLYSTCHLIIKNSTWTTSLFFCSIGLSTQTHILQLSQWPQILRWSQLRKSMMKARIVALQLINDMWVKKYNLETYSNKRYVKYFKIC